MAKINVFVHILRVDEFSLFVRPHIPAYFSVLDELVLHVCWTV